MQGAVRVGPWNGGLALNEPNSISNQMNQSKFEDQKEFRSTPLRPKQLLYRRKKLNPQTLSFIRSKKTADLLQLHSGDAAMTRQVADPPTRSLPVQPGGFLRSRRTAALLGIIMPAEIESSHKEAD